ncbi:MAG: glycosyltransferase family 39 protein [Acidobacteriaceae bacterium]
MDNDLHLSGVETAREAGYPLAIAAVVFLSRYLTRGGLYYVDGPRLVRAILDHTYVVQRPGYWLYCRLGSIFRDPALGLIVLNEVFSAAGVAVFFLLCRRMHLNLRTSVLAALAYSSIFFVWFAGDVQSSYASQILFAPLTIYCFLRYWDKPSRLWLIASAVSFAIGTGLRPSDGAFLAPLTLYMLLQFVGSWKERCFFLLLTGVACLGWYIPTQMALRASHAAHLGVQLGSLAYQVSPLLTGINARSIANILRVTLPLFAAFWMLLPLLFLHRSRRENWIFALWVAPGLAFFSLIYMADATYLTFLAGGVILFAATAKRPNAAAALLLLCFVFNVALFVGARPLRSTGKFDTAVNFYVVKYCNYGIRHQWSSTIGHH